MSSSFPFAFHGRGIGFLLILVLMLSEYLIHRLNHADDSYDARETAASLAIALGSKAVRALSAGVTAWPIMFVYRHRLFDVSPGAWTWIALFLGAEFCYYVHHLAMHKIRWLWATHSVHHSPTRLNLSAGIRLGWGAHLTGGFLFYLPLIALGFNPAAVFATLAAGLFYQFFLHMAYAPNLGPLEWVLNTPRHHHVHHASNPKCIDRNFGAVLIVFDRLFGTFAAAPKDEAMQFGIAGLAPSTNPFNIVFAAWLQMFSEMLQAEGMAAKLRTLFAQPAQENAGRGGSAGAHACLRRHHSGAMRKHRTVVRNCAPENLEIAGSLADASAPE